MSCGLSRQKLIGFNIPREGQICKGEYDDEIGIRHVCNCLISKHRSEVQQAPLTSIAPPLTGAQYWFVSFQVNGSKSKSGLTGWRARIFVLASKCMAFYHVNIAQSIYYEENNLMIKLLFESQRDCREFYNELHSVSFRFSMVIDLKVIDPIKTITITYSPSPVLPDHYDTTEFDSPLHSMNAGDFALNSVGGSHEVILPVCTVSDLSDPYAHLQMIENPDNPFLRGLKMYRCHLEAQASNKKQKSNSNNILHMSWPMHQRFDGLNLIGDKHMVPSIAFKFIKSEKEKVEVVSGYPCEKYKVTIGIETNNDLDLLQFIGSTLKQGSEFDKINNRWITFVHVDSDQEFKTFLEIKYKIAQELWKQKAPIGDEIDDEAMEVLERKATLEVNEDSK